MAFGRALFVAVAGVSASMPYGSGTGAGGYAVDEYNPDEEEEPWGGEDDFWNGDRWGPTVPDRPPTAVAAATTSARPVASAFRSAAESKESAKSKEERALVSDVEYLVGAFGIVSILLLAARVIFLQRQVGKLNGQLAKSGANGFQLEEGICEVEDFFPVKQAQGVPVSCEIPVATPVKEPQDLAVSQPYVAKRSFADESPVEESVSLEDEKSDVDDSKSAGSSRKKKVGGKKRAVSSPRRGSDASSTKVKVRGSETSSTKRTRSPSKGPRKLKSKASN